MSTNDSELRSIGEAISRCDAKKRLNQDKLTHLNGELADFNREIAILSRKTETINTEMKWHNEEMDILNREYTNLLKEQKDCLDKIAQEAKKSQAARH
jgi:peptidoglycan hydrolase CwlO-like protein